MMNLVFSLLILGGITVSLLTGNIEQVQNAVLTEGGNAVALIFTLAGGLCFWSGMMKIAQQGGLSKKLASLLRPALKLIFRGLPPDGEACQAISLNIAANLLGLGNAATPLGIEAMKKLQALNRKKDTASNYMVTFAVINSSSVQLIPTTLALMRQRHQSRSPLEILPAVIITSVLSLFVGVVVSLILGRRKK